MTGEIFKGINLFLTNKRKIRINLSQEESMTHLQVNITVLKLRIHAAKTFHILKENSTKTSKWTLFQTQNMKTTFALIFFVCTEVSKAMQQDSNGNMEKDLQRAANVSPTN